MAPRGLDSDAVARRLRLVTGLVLFAYVTTHLANHALGIVSLQAMEAGRLVFLGVWRHPIGTALLYPALLGHIALVLWAVFRRRHLRMPRWEVVRLLLGVAMPLLLVPHIFGTRVLHDVFGVEDTYGYVVGGIWVLHPESALLQALLLVVAWVHGCMGIHHWLKLQPWYPRAVPLLYGAALLLPALALIGFADAGQQLRALAAEPDWM